VTDFFASGCILRREVESENVLDYLAKQHLAEGVIFTKFFKTILEVCRKMN